MTAMRDEDELLTALEVAQILKVRHKWVYEAAGRGDLPYVKLPGGRYVRFRREDVDEFIRRHREEEA